MGTYTLDLQKTFQETFQMNSKLTSGLYNMIDIKDMDIGTTPKELVYSEDRVNVYHYIPAVAKPHAVPLLVAYALVNKQYMMDLQENRSTIKKMLAAGVDVYMIDWGYPEYVDKFLTMEDYVDGYLNNVVDFVRETHNLPAINLLGICQGGTLSAVYCALYPEKIKNFVSLVMPFDFSTQDGLLLRWSREMDIDSVLAASHNTVSGSSMNASYNMLKPFELSFDKYINFIDKLDDKEAVLDFLRMESWIYDSPDQAGPMLKKFIKDFYQGNKFMKNELEVGGRHVDVKKITMPVLCMLAQKDHLVPPAATRPFLEYIGSKDKTLLEFPVGHIGMFVSSKALKEVGPKIAKWIKEH